LLSRAKIRKTSEYNHFKKEILYKKTNHHSFTDIRKEKSEKMWWSLFAENHPKPATKVWDGFLLS
jgi:hypothetical protein